MALWRARGAVSSHQGDPLFEPDVENILVSASRSQAAIVLEFARAALGESDEYRWSNDGVNHKSTRTRVTDHLKRCVGGRWGSGRTYG